MKNLLRLQDLSIEEINNILDLAQSIKDKEISPLVENKIIANLFFEPSTRTHYSFATAEARLGCKTIDFSPNSSSMKKGETFYDTIKTFESFGVDGLVIRDAKNQWYKELIDKIKVPIINAGDGSADHPTQTLLDLLTIKQEFGKFEGLKVLVVGDISHSRVAHSNILNMRRLGMEVFVSAPDIFKDNQYNYVDFDEYISKVDVINMLRIQNERLEKDCKYNVQQYNKEFGLNNERLRKMKPNAIIIHPAPFNRNVEINDDVVESKPSRIFKQISNGVYVRMAVLLTILKGNNHE
ncbi:MAG: aspartate carbamoyltransferase catalytic subunit [Mycoplasmataceae bacterium]|nr:aspartate carbamoyltransferase catalytic subunit [Mycoplasmataceae bacterium]